MHAIGEQQGGRGGDGKGEVKSPMYSHNTHPCVTCSSGRIPHGNSAEIISFGDCSAREAVSACHSFIF